MCRTRIQLLRGGCILRSWIFAGGLGTWDARAYVTIAGRKGGMIISVGPVQPLPASWHA